MTQNINQNLRAVGEMLTSFAGTVKGIGYLSMAVGPISLLIGIIKFTSRYGGIDSTIAGMGLALIGVALLALGLLLWIAGVFLAAMGEVLLSLVSIEANISHLNQTIQLVAGVTPKPSAVASEKHCRKCGNVLESAAAFCEHCGQKAD